MTKSGGDDSIKSGGGDTINPLLFLKFFSSIDNIKLTSDSVVKAALQIHYGVI